jgi:chromate transporter
MTEVPIEASPSTSARAVRLPEIARIFLKIGGLSYGWGIIGVMQSEVQEKRQWIGKEEFVEGLALGPVFSYPSFERERIRIKHRTP